jgi:hypothetical protein
MMVFFYKSLIREDSLLTWSAGMNVFLGSVKKAAIVCVMLAGFQQLCHAELERLYGYWVDSTVYDQVITNHEDIQSTMFTLLYACSTFWRSAKDMTERYFDTEECIVDKVEWISERKLRIMFAHPRSNSSYKPPDIVVQIIFDDVIKILSGPNNEKAQLFYRVSNHSKEPIQRAVINADGVGFRVKPSLESNIWLLLNEDHEVEILGRSSEKQKIGNVEAYWYEVRYTADFLIDGWVFGTYLDFRGPKNSALFPDIL